MSRYLSGDSANFKTTYLKRIADALTSVETNYKGMAFYNANEKDIDLRDDLDKIKKQLESARDALNAMTFE